MSMSQTTLLNTIEIEPQHPATHSIIWLHGLGADGSDFVPIIPELNLTASTAVRFIFPHAPVRAVTLNQGHHMRAWFDIVDITPNADVDTLGITESVLAIEQLIAQEEARGIPTSNIILAGFSQGAAMALTVGLCHAKKLGGVIALSGFLPTLNDILTQASKANEQLPMFIAHGTDDPIVPYAFGKATYVALKQAGYPIEWHSYVMQHSVCAEEIAAIGQWLQQQCSIT